YHIDRAGYTPSGGIPPYRIVVSGTSFNKIEQRSRNITLSHCRQRAYDAFIRRRLSPWHT
ncbi:hypothetical protein, partial [Dickeya fangzhongdai]|uniref:hypothetical protein n=1 Tax=Dickeya fangzhongdai TaxID=1778540 RepID=UPI001969AD16